MTCYSAACNTAPAPFLVQGQPYYLTVTNPNPVAVTFAYGVWFDIVTLTNCMPQSNYVWQAGIPRYFQFSVPTNALPPRVSVGGWSRSGCCLPRAPTFTW